MQQDAATRFGVLKKNFSTSGIIRDARCLPF